MKETEESIEKLFGTLEGRKILKETLITYEGEAEADRYAIRGNARRIKRAFWLLYIDNIDEFRSFVKNRDLPVVLELFCVILWADAREHLALREYSLTEKLVVTGYLAELNNVGYGLYIPRATNYFNLPPNIYV